MVSFTTSHHNLKSSICQLEHLCHLPIAAVAKEAHAVNTLCKIIRAVEFILSNLHIGFTSSHKATVAALPSSAISLRLPSCKEILLCGSDRLLPAI